MNKIVLSIPFLALLLASCSEGNEKKVEQRIEVPTLTASEKLEVEVGDKARSMFQPLSELTKDIDVKPSQEEVELGKLLYFDKRLSKNNDISCNSCHNLSTFGVDNEPTSPGDKGQLGDRNSPTVLNAAFHTSQFWDGRAATIEDQAGMPILNPVEMAIPDKDFLVEKLSKIELYKSKFAEVYGSANALNYNNIQNAIGAFERTLVTPSKFDEYLKGNPNALNAEEKKGLKLFINTGCTSCHSGALLGGTMYQKFGVFGDYWKHTNSKKIDEGRFAHTGNEADKYSFKVPSLRNVAKTYPYFHDGSVNDLKKAAKIMAKINLNKDLSDRDAESIVKFLNTLTGKIPEDAAKVPEELL